MPSSWGFLAETVQEQGAPSSEVREWFKIHLDEELLQKMRQCTKDPTKVYSIHDVEKWYCDYFRFLYRCIEARLKGELASRWEDARIEFIFSVPTTWRPNPTVERFRSIISRAGFGSSPNHTAVIGLTEAEAAAVHTARNSPAIFKENEILLVCDVGGGTTDLSAFRIKNANYMGSIQLEQLDVVFGAAIGSVQLDTLFEEAVLAKLEAADEMEPIGLPLGQTAWEMRVSKEYQNAKCDYGSEESLADTDVFSVRVPYLDKNYVNEQFGISGGDMQFQRDELRPFFDSQIAKLFDMIDKQIVRLQRITPNEQVTHLILSGGLGNSAYVRDSLESRYAFGRTQFPNAFNMQVRIAPDPQLVVCKGNVADRVQKLKSGQSVLTWRCCWASYGTLCKILYEPDNPQHFGLPTERDTLDGKMYVKNYVDWFIKQGEPVSSDNPIVRTFRKKCSPTTPFNPYPGRVFPTEVICSEVDRSMLPQVMNAACQWVCRIDSDFSSVPLNMFKLKNRHWWSTAPKYHRIDYVVKVNLGPADITFELWHNGIKLSRDNPIKVEWHAAAPPEPNQSPVQPDHRFSLPVAQGPVPIGMNGGMNGAMNPGMNGAMNGAMNGGMNPGMNGGTNPGMNGAMYGGMNPGMVGGMNGGSPSSPHNNVYMPYAGQGNSPPTYSTTQFPRTY
jgi:hypothetical protein